MNVESHQQLPADLPPPLPKEHQEKLKDRLTELNDEITTKISALEDAGKANPITKIFNFFPKLILESKHKEIDELIKKIEPLEDSPQKADVVISTPDDAISVIQRRIIALQKDPNFKFAHLNESISGMLDPHDENNIYLKEMEKLDAQIKGYKIIKKEENKPTSETAQIGKNLLTPKNGRPAPPSIPTTAVAQTLLVAWKKFTDWISNKEPTPDVSDRRKSMSEVSDQTTPTRPPPPKIPVPLRPDEKLKIEIQALSLEVSRAKTLAGSDEWGGWTEELTDRQKKLLGLEEALTSWTKEIAVASKKLANDPSLEEIIASNQTFKKIQAALDLKKMQLEDAPPLKKSEAKPQKYSEDLEVVEFKQQGIDFEDDDDEGLLLPELGGIEITEGEAPRFVNNVVLYKQTKELLDSIQKDEKEYFAYVEAKRDRIEQKFNELKYAVAEEIKEFYCQFKIRTSKALNSIKKRNDDNIAKLQELLQNHRVELLQENFGVDLQPFIEGANPLATAILRTEILDRLSRGKPSKRFEEELTKAVSYELKKEMDALQYSEGDLIKTGGEAREVLKRLDQSLIPLDRRINYIGFDIAAMLLREPDHERRAKMKESLCQSAINLARSGNYLATSALYFALGSTAVMRPEDRGYESLSDSYHENLGELASLFIGMETDKAIRKHNSRFLFTHLIPHTLGIKKTLDMSKNAYDSTPNEMKNAWKASDNAIKDANEAILLWKAASRATQSKTDSLLSKQGGLFHDRSMLAEILDGPPGQITDALLGLADTVAPRRKAT